VRTPRAGLVLFAAAATLVATFGTPAVGAPKPVTIMADDFPGSHLNTSKWSLAGGKACTDPSNVWVSGGYLQIRTGQTGSHAYCGGRVRATVSLRPGVRIQMRANFALPQGFHGGMALYGTQGSWPAKGEIDMDELLGRARHVDHTTAWAGTVGDLSTRCGLSHDYYNAQTLNKTWHVYELDWQPGYMVYRLDGHQVWSFTATEFVAQHCTYPFTSPTNPFGLFITTGAGGRWAGAPSSSGYPAILKVDWVRITAAAK